MTEVDLNNVITIKDYAALTGMTEEKVSSGVMSGFIQSVPIGEFKYVVLTAKEAKRWHQK